MNVCRPFQRTLWLPSSLMIPSQGKCWIFVSDCHPLLHNGIKSKPLAFENNPIPNSDVSVQDRSSSIVLLCSGTRPVLWLCPCVWKQNRVMSMLLLYYHTITDLVMALPVHASCCVFARISWMLQPVSFPPEKSWAVVVADLILCSLRLSFFKSSPTPCQ